MMVVQHLAEAAMLAAGHTRKKKFLFLKQFIQNHRDVVETYAKGQNLEVVEIANIKTV